MRALLCSENSQNTRSLSSETLAPVLTLILPGDSTRSRTVMSVLKTGPITPLAYSFASRKVLPEIILLATISEKFPMALRQRRMMSA